MRTFFSRPEGVGAPPNIYMLTPSGVYRNARQLITNPRWVWCRLKVMAYQLRTPDAPWLTADAIAILDRGLTRKMTGFEWGSGRSTVWLASRLRSLTSIEHDPRWYRDIAARLGRKGLDNVDYRLVPVEAGGEAYVDAIRTFADRSLDLILVDGRFREQCLKAAVPKLSERSWLVLDNADDGYDTSPCARLRRITTTNGVWDTALFVRPETP